MILHLDMDAFFAAVEVLDRPELEGRCILVGGDSDRGVVTTASYAARVYGVHSAMPMFMAKRLCPNAVILRPRMARYKEVSSQIMSILKEVSPVVEQVSIDEAYIDLAGLDRLSGSTEAIARGLKERIRKAIGLTCSIGGAPVKFLSKIASDRHKPDGLTLIPPEAVDSTIKALPVEKIPGVGKMALERLHRLGIRTMGDVRSYPEKSLTACLGKFGYRLKELSHGIDRTTVSPDQPPKSVSSEETLSRDSTDRTLLRRLMLNQSEEVGHQLRKLRYFARTITVKIKHSDFRQITRSHTLINSTQSTDIIYKTATEMLDEYALPLAVRLIGVGASNLIPEGTPRQLDLFPSGSPSHRGRISIDQTVDHIREKFGSRSIVKATAVIPAEWTPDKKTNR